MSQRRGSALIATGVGFLLTGLVGVAVGLVIGLLHVRAPSTLGIGATSCGSALSPDDFAGPRCDAKIHDRKVLTYVVLGVAGGVALVGAVGLLAPGFWLRIGDPKPSDPSPSVRS